MVSGIYFFEVPDGSRRYRLSGRFAVPEGSSAPGVVASALPPCKSFAPIPPTPFPGGEGGEPKFFCKGLRPLQPPACTGRFAG